MNFDCLPYSQNQQVLLPILQKKEVTLYVKREDEIHPFVSGNKFRKLKYNIAEAKQQQATTLLTFGGAFSNHIVAVAVAGKLSGFSTVGIIRGEELGKDLERTLQQNATLRIAAEHGMQFKFISRTAYRHKTTPDFTKKIIREFGDFYHIPEGGTNTLAIKGCEEILTPEDEKFDYICCAVGTGGTISGLINTVKSTQKVIGFPALKGDFLQTEIETFIKRNNHWSLTTEYHFGGYGKYNQELIRCINDFKTETSIPTDPIYTGKMIYGILDMIQKDKFPKGSKLLAIHTGGLQGISGINQQLKKKNQELIHI